MAEDRSDLLRPHRSHRRHHRYLRLRCLGRPGTSASQRTVFCDTIDNRSPPQSGARSLGKEPSKTITMPIFSVLLLSFFTLASGKLRADGRELTPGLRHGTSHLEGSRFYRRIARTGPRVLGMSNAAARLLSGGNSQAMQRSASVKGYLYDKT
jgi:hypothetical protein